MNTTPTTSGEFVVTHNSDGQAGFTMQIEASIYTSTKSKGSVREIILEPNYPRTPCYWAQDSEIRLDRYYIAPGNSARVSWSGAQSGVDNKIKEYQISYKIGENTF
jgi:hypothetical protein